MSYAMIPDDSINYEEGAILCDNDFDDIIILVSDHYGQYMLQELVSRYTIKGVEEEALQRERDLILIMEGVDEGKACSGNALMIPRDLCHSLLKHLFAKAEDIPQSFVTEPEGYKMILNVAQAIRDSAESED